jgi:hypothetical protein
MPNEINNLAKGGYVWKGNEYVYQPVTEFIYQIGGLQ